MNSPWVGIVVLVLISSALSGVGYYAVKEFKKWYDDNK